MRDIGLGVELFPCDNTTFNFPERIAFQHRRHADKKIVSSLSLFASGWHRADLEVADPNPSATIESSLCPAGFKLLAIGHSQALRPIAILIIIR